MFLSVGVLQTQNMLELKMRLEELQMENEYQLRLKDMNYNEKMKELSDKFTQQIESLKSHQQVCWSPTRELHSKYAQAHLPHSL